MLYPDINLQKRTQQNTTRYRTALYLRLSREMAIRQRATVLQTSVPCWKPILQTTRNCASWMSLWTMATPAQTLLGLDSDTFYIYHVAAVMVDNLRRLLLGINLSDKAIMDFDFPGVGFPV